ncbi:CD225/dispanin family protein [Weeksellaceae bacterium KMM 9713]|uniref:CD225/dispanin family protein n=1 Tax=Profundicola chukchiensis TaxID=2961959 RepID=A0A9X4RXI0_9FLAO|nr:CD225/dispanin family protein [Profundicola chukchiensis]MDG4946469.1 CD225/dispanin family protein [Profundicola chukchiensis]
METFNKDNYIAPQNYMVLAIIATILGCCSTFGIGFILGLVGIYFASQVNARFNVGDYEGAEKNSKYARTLSLVALGLFLVSALYSAYVVVFHPEIWSEQLEIIQQAIEEAQANQ